MKFFCKIFFLFLSINSFAQNQLWKGYYSYNEIRAIAPAASSIYFATDNGVFKWDETEESVEIYNSINGFKAFDISSIGYSPGFNKILIGNTNGQVAIIDANTKKTFYLNDIVNKSSIPDNLKAINDIFIKDGYAYLATKYGISMIRLNDNTFGDSYFIGNSGEYTSILQLTIVEDYIYALTEDFGIKRIATSNQNKIDFSQWEIFNAEKWLSIANLDGVLVGVKEDLSLNRFDNNVPVSVGSVYGGFYRITAFNKELTVVTHEVIRLYNQNLSMQNEFIFNSETGRFNCGLVKNGIYYAGTKENGAIIVSPNSKEKHVISPSGAKSNNAYKMIQNNNDFYVIYGGMEVEFQPIYQSYGLSKYNASKGWEYLNSDKIYNVRSTNYVSFNPRKKGQIYVSSFLDGLVDVTLNNSNFSESNSELFNYLNSPLNYVVDGSYNSTRVSGPNFDKAGVGWITNSWSNTPLKSFDLNGNWKNYSFEQFFASTSNPQASEKFGVPVIDKNNTKWVGSNNNGLFAFNETRNNKTLRIASGNQGNLPSLHINTLAIDNNNQLWIGTGYGIRVLSSVDQFINSNSLTTNPIIILQDGIAEELLYQQQILKITVDGANNKWVSVAGAGVFQFSPNGQETLQRFNMQNSPLPSNDITDILVDGKSGEVFFVSNKGIVSLSNFITETSESLSNVKVFPNPVRPDFTGEVKITGLITGANVKITDVAGNLVFEKKAEGGTVLWNTYNFSGAKVASGVYMVFIASADGEDTTIKKIMIIR